VIALSQIAAVNPLPVYISAIERAAVDDCESAVRSTLHQGVLWGDRDVVEEDGRGGLTA